MNILVHVFGEPMFVSVLRMFEQVEVLGQKFLICPALEDPAMVLQSDGTNSFYPTYSQQHLGIPAASLRCQHLWKLT